MLDWRVAALTDTGASRPVHPIRVRAARYVLISALMAAESVPLPELPSRVVDAAAELGVPLALLDPAFVALRSLGGAGGRDIVVETLLLELLDGEPRRDVLEHLERLLVKLILSKDLASHALTPERLAQAGVLTSLEPTPERAVAHSFIVHCVIEARVALVDRLRAGRPVMAYLHRVADNYVLGWHEQVDRAGARIAQGCRELVADPRFRAQLGFELVGADGRMVDVGKPLRLGQIMRCSVSLPGSDGTRQDPLPVLERELARLGRDDLDLLTRGPIGAATVIAKLLDRVLAVRPGAFVSLREVQRLVRGTYEAFVDGATGDEASSSKTGIEIASKWLHAISDAGEQRDSAFDELKEQVRQEVLREISYASRRVRVSAMVDWFMHRWSDALGGGSSRTLSDVCSALACMRPGQDELASWAKSMRLRGRSSVLAQDRKCVLHAMHRVLMCAEPND